RFLSLSPGGRNYPAFPLVTALCSMFALLTGGALVALAGTLFHAADRAGAALGGVALIMQALTWANTQRKVMRRG
ncbi:MAG: hypothetical protein ACJ72N_27340, partial [Labedaea sp.]